MSSEKELRKLFKEKTMADAIANLSMGSVPRQRIVNVALTYLGLTPELAPMHSDNGPNPFCPQDDRLCNPWCSEFVSTVFHAAGHSLSVWGRREKKWLAKDVSEIIAWFTENHRFFRLDDPQSRDLSPQPGDYVTMTGRANSLAEVFGGCRHSAIVYSVQGNDLQVIEGNNPERQPVGLRIYQNWRTATFENGKKFYGFGHWNDAGWLPNPALCLESQAAAVRHCRL